MKTITKNKTSIVSGDLFDYIEQYVHQGNNGFSVIVPHVCNNVNLFGAGFAAAVAKHYPLVKANYHMLGNKNVLGYVQFIEVFKNPTYGHKLIFANMIAQNGTINNNNIRPLNYFALCNSMDSVKKYVLQNFDKENPVQIHAPKFGCGLAGGNWNFIQELVADIWKNIPVLIYQL